MEREKTKGGFRTFILALAAIVLTAAGCGGGGGGGSSSSSSIGIGTPESGSSLNAQASSQSVTLTWESPTTNSDGSALTDLSGYKVYYGTSTGNYAYSVDVGSTAGASISSLSAGTWCFAVTAYDTSGNESDYSDSVCT